MRVVPILAAVALGIYVIYLSLRGINLWNKRQRRHLEDQDQF